MFTSSIQRVLPLLAFVFACACAALPSQSYAAHSWGSYHWARTANPFTLKLVDNLTTNDWKSKLAQTSQDWNSPQLFLTTSPLLTAVVAGQPSKRCAMVAGTTQVCNGSYGKNGWLGLATINIAGSHITQGSAKLNDTYFTTATYNNPNEKLHVMCQEIAHTFGLGHTSENGSSQNTCMDYFSNTGANAASTLSTKPNLHDFEQLNLIYAHLDSTSTLATIAALSASLAEPTDDIESWGQLKSQSSNGRSSTYEKHNRDGSQTITHVYWTSEAAANCKSCDHRYDR